MRIAHSLPVDRFIHYYYFIFTFRLSSWFPVGIAIAIDHSLICILNFFLSAIEINWMLFISTFWHFPMYRPTDKWQWTTFSMPNYWGEKNTASHVSGVFWSTQKKETIQIHAPLIKTHTKPIVVHNVWHTNLRIKISKWPSMADI